MGSWIWDFDRIQECGQKRARTSDNMFDRHFANLILGHVHFKLCKEAKEANIATGKKYFEAAAGAFGAEDSLNDRQKYFVGRCYLIWAEHEAWIGNMKDESEEHAKRARSYGLAFETESSLNATSS